MDQKTSPSSQPKPQYPSGIDLHKSLSAIALGYWRMVKRQTPRILLVFFGLMSFGVGTEQPATGVLLGVLTFIGYQLWRINSRNEKDRAASRLKAICESPQFADTLVTGSEVLFHLIEQFGEEKSSSMLGAFLVDEQITASATIDGILELVQRIKEEKDSNKRQLLSAFVFTASNKLAEDLGIDERVIKDCFAVGRANRKSGEIGAGS